MGGLTQSHPGGPTIWLTLTFSSSGNITTKPRANSSGVRQGRSTTQSKHERNLHPFLSSRERRRLVRLLKRFRRINPDEKIATAFSELLAQYPYLRDHLGGALIAATARVKHLILVTANARHLEPIKEIRVARFPGILGS